MTVVAITVFVVAYVLIASDRVNKTLAALSGAAVVVALGVVGSEDVFFSRETGIDWDVIFLLLGMMIIVSVLRETRCSRIHRDLGGQARQRFSAADHDPTGVGDRGRLGAVGQCHHSVVDRAGHAAGDRLAINAAPFLMAEVFASNIGGAATLVGDPPNIIIASQSGLVVQRLSRAHDADRDPRHGRFPRHVAAACSAARSVSMPERVADVMSLNEREAIRYFRLLIKCGVVLVAVFAAFVTHSVLHIAPSIVALLGAGIPGPDLPAGAIRLPVQRRVGDAAVFRRTVHHGGRPGEDRGH